MLKRGLEFLLLVAMAEKHHGTGKTKDPVNGEGENSGKALDHILFWNQQEKKTRTKYQKFWQVNQNDRTGIQAVA